MHAAIIGAGLAGLVCARDLHSHGHRVTIYDKGQSPGGRMCSHLRSPGRCADHGTRSFIVRDDRFAREVDVWMERGLVSAWRPELVSISEPGLIHPTRIGAVRYVGSPAMDAPARDIAERLGDGVDIRLGRTVMDIHRAAGSWMVRDMDGDVERFDAVALAVPAPRAAELLAEIPHLLAVASAVPMTPSWATTVAFPDRLPIGFDAANVLIGGRHPHSGVLSWMDRESSKPGRPGDECWVLNAGEEWTREHMEDDTETIGERMVEAFFAAVGVDPSTPCEMHTHLWRYAFPVAPLCDGCLFDDQLMVGACGDWCMGARVEGAYLSGLAMACRLLGEHSDFLEPCVTNHSHG